MTLGAVFLVEIRIGLPPGARDKILLRLAVRHGAVQNAESVGMTLLAIDCSGAQCSSRRTLPGIFTVA